MLRELAEMRALLDAHESHVRAVMAAVEEELRELEARAEERARLREALDAALIRLGLVEGVEAPEERLAGVRIQTQEAQA